MIEDFSIGNKLTGFYRGIVKKHLSNGFCKIWIPSVYPEQWQNEPDKLPDAEQAAPLSFGTNNGLGIFSYPNIDSIVWCFFANGDQNFPIYFASTLGGEYALKKWNRVRAMPGAKEDAFIHKIHVKCADIEFNETGTIHLHTEDVEVKSEEDKSKRKHYCDIRMDQSGNINIESTATITIKTPALKIVAETQMESESPNIILSSSVDTKIISPSIDLDAKAGGIALTSAAESVKI